MVTVKIPNRFLHQLWLKKQAKHLFHSEDRLKTKVVGGKNPGIVSPVKHVMSGEEQERQTAAAEDLLSMNGQSQIYTATKDTLFTQTAPVVSKTHSLVSIRYIPSKAENSLNFIFTQTSILAHYSNKSKRFAVILFC